MDIFQQNSVTNVPAFVQLAGLAAMTGPQDHVLQQTARLKAKRDFVVEAFNKIDGIDCMTPDGSFYVFPDIRGTGMTAQQFADHLVEEHGVDWLGFQQVRDAYHALHRRDAGARVLSIELWDTTSGELASAEVGALVGVAVGRGSCMHQAPIQMAQPASVWLQKFVGS